MGFPHKSTCQPKSLVSHGLTFFDLDVIPYVSAVSIPSDIVHLMFVDEIATLLKAINRAESMMVRIPGQFEL